MKENKYKARALIIDDEQSICTSLAGVLSDENWASITANSGKDGIRLFIRERPDLVLLDVWMRGMDGIETLQSLKQLEREIPVVIMSGHANIETAVKATKLGAFDFLEKPLSLDKLIPMLDFALAMKDQRSKEQGSSNHAHKLIGNSVAMQDIRQRISLVAPKNAWVLITGENGTGKEVVAQQIHTGSPRASQPFVAINCAAIPEELIESELFGHEKGAFTNAVARKKGKFEIANKGTLFLDEIGDMSLKTQAKILRILQEQQFERIGGRESINVDVRVIAATNKDLQEEIQNGTFREDLFYRLNVVPFHLAPLRERENDVLMLADHFISEFMMELKEPRKILMEDAKQAMLAYHWPGNVRELRNMIERICIMTTSAEIRSADLPEQIRNSLAHRRNVQVGSEPSTLKEARTEFEKSFILSKLEENDWNVSRTAEAIGIERSNLHRKLKAYGIDPRQTRE